MTVVDVGTLLAEGLAAHQVGHLLDAEACYFRAVTAQPEHSEALHLLGVVAFQCGRLQDAATQVRRAVAIAPGQPTFWNTLGVVERSMSQLADAVRSFGRAVELAPDYVDGWVNLAAACEHLGDHLAEAAALGHLTALQPANAQAWGRRGVLAYQGGQHADAGAYFAQAVALAPADADAWSNLGAVQIHLGQYPEAEVSLRRAVALRPDALGAWNNLGNVLVAQAQWQEAAAILAQVVQQAPDDPNGRVNLGHALKGLERHAEARDAYQRVLDLCPGHPSALLGLGDALQGLNDLPQAIACYEQALALRPDDADVHEHLGIALQSYGRIDDAAAMFRRCLELDPDRANVHSGLIFVLDLQEGAEHEAIEQRQRWNARFARPSSARQLAYANAPDPARPLRVGYVSADFRHHSAAYAILPILRAHDRTQVQVVCYANVTRPDHVTAQVRALADRWHDVTYLSDAALADLIRTDEIDILVDLSGHSGGNRLPAFALAPAPVQVTAWGYAASTGLDTVRYFLADPIVVPPEARASYSEEVVSLPSVLCYEAPAYAPAVSLLPAIERGYITFGAFNRLPKISADTVATWGRVMAAVPDARLIVKCGGADLSPERERLLARFGAHGVAAERVTLLGGTPHPDHLAAHDQIDLMLDTFPQSGGITTLDALVMGVPVVTLLGQRVPGRVSASLLSTLGLHDLIAGTPDEYVKIAARLAADRDRLVRERASLRDRLYASPIANAQVYTRAVEAVYRELWQRWCTEDRTPSSQGDLTPPTPLSGAERGEPGCELPLSPWERGLGGEVSP